MKHLKSLFQTSDYKAYLKDALNDLSAQQKGQRLKLAAHLGCNPSYISQVLNDHQHLTPEQAFATSQFLGHTDSEENYFLTLVLYSRSGTRDLKKYYSDKIEKLRVDQLVIKNRIKSNRSLSSVDQAQYYKVWYHAAIHMIVSLPHFHRREHIAEALDLPLRTVNESIEFLISIGLINEKAGFLAQGEKNLLIGADSPFLIRHQSNWRLRALLALDNQKPEDLHYSGVITCSHSDLATIREIMIRTIQEVRSIIKDSTDETLAVYNLDLFNILKKEK